MPDFMQDLVDKYSTNIQGTPPPRSGRIFVPPNMAKVRVSAKKEPTMAEKYPRAFGK